MDKDEQKEKSTPPVIAYKTLKNFFRSLAPGVPGRIDKSVMTTLSGATQSQLLHALKALKCIAPNGTPESRLTTLVKSEGKDYQEALKKAMEETYPFLGTGMIDLSTVTTHQLQEQFEAMANGDTVRKCMTFFIPAAKDAGYALSPYLKEPGKRAPSNGKAKRVRAASPGNEFVPATPPAAKTVPTWQQMLLDKFPSLDPAWPDDVKAKWFESFEKLMQHGKGATS